MESAMAIVPFWPKLGRVNWSIQRLIGAEKKILCLPSDQAGGFAGIWVFDASPLLFGTKSAAQTEIDNILANGGAEQLDHRRVWSRFEYRGDGISDLHGV